MQIQQGLAELMAQHCSRSIWLGSERGQFIPAFYPAAVKMALFRSPPIDIAAAILAFPQVGAPSDRAGRSGHMLRPFAVAMAERKRTRSVRGL